MDAQRVNVAFFLGVWCALGLVPASITGHRVVSYLAGLESIEQEPEPGVCGPAGCEWRIYDPETRRDELFLQVSAVPSNVFWDQRFEWVYYRLGNKVFRAAWKSGAQPELILSVPEHLASNPWSVSRLWIDEETGAWEMLTWEQVDEIDYAGLWRYSKEEPKWQLLRKEQTRCECGDCPCVSVLESFVHDEGYVFLADLLDSMRIESHRQRLGRAVSEDEQEPLYIPSRTAGNVGLKVTVAMGDSLHAMAPLVYVNRETGEERTVYETTEPCYAFQQLGFAEEGKLLLVGTEYETRCGRLIDMKTGNLVRALPVNSTLAAWVTPPKN